MSYFGKSTSCLEDEALVDEELALEIATALSLSENQKENKDYLGKFQDETEQVEVAIALSETLREEEDIKKAVEVSRVAFAEDRDFRNVLISQQLNIFNEDENPQQWASSRVPLVELQEQLLEWSGDPADDLDLTFSDDLDTEAEELPLVYKNYRFVPTIFSDNEMWSPGAIRQQLRELRVSQGTEEVREWQESQCNSERCLVCLTNVATRVAIPCGHKLCCRSCLPSLTERANYYSVTSADGEVLPTDRQVPVQCFTCRAIVGQVITIC